MATKDEMIAVVNSAYKNSGVVKDFMRRVMRDAENNGRCYNGGQGEHNIPCTFWVVGDYIITYLTDNWELHAGMLTEEMMDDLIIEAI